MQMVGWLAIVLYSAAFISGWVAIFAPYAFGNRAKLIAVLAPALGVGTLAVAVPWIFKRLVQGVMLASVLWPSLLLFLLVVTVGVSVALGISLFKGGRWGFVPFLSALYGFFAAPTVRYFAWVAPRMWRRYSVGEIPFGGVIPLALGHVILCGLMGILTVLIWYRFLRRTTPELKVCITMSLVSVVFGGIAFVLTFPRAGDEMLLLWLFITPALILVAIVLLASAFPLTIIVLCSKDFSRCQRPSATHQRQ